MSLYAPRIVSQLGGDTAKLVIPEQFDALFSNKAKCQDDPQGSIYPPMDAITQAFFTGYRAASELLRSADDQALEQPNQLGGRMAELFPTNGSMYAFYVGGHLMMHLGQMSTWRRMIGLGPA